MNRKYSIKYETEISKRCFCITKGRYLTDFHNMEIEGYTGSPTYDLIPSHLKFSQRRQTISVSFQHIPVFHEQN